MFLTSEHRLIYRNRSDFGLPSDWRPTPTPQNSTMPVAQPQPTPQPVVQPPSAQTPPTFRTNPYTGEIITGANLTPEELRVSYITSQQKNDSSYNPDVDPIYQRKYNSREIAAPQRPSQVVNNKATLDALRESGQITEEQYLSSIQAFQQGAVSVDPFGFNADKQLPMSLQGRPKGTQGTGSPGTGSAAAETLLSRGDELKRNSAARGSARKAKGATQPTGQPSATPNAPTGQQTTPSGTPTGTPSPTSVPNADGTTTPDPAMAGFLATVANLPPEAQFLAPYLQSYAQSVQQALTENATQTAGMYSDIQKTYGGIDQVLKDMQTGFKESSTAIQGLLEDARDQNDDFIAKQKKAEEQRLEWEETKQSKVLAKQKRQTHDANIAQIALAGGFGQDAGIRAVNESDAEYDDKMRDLEQTFTFARTDLNAKYSSMYLENNNNYINGTVKNMQDLQSALERIGGQQIGNIQARQTAEQNLLSKAWETQTSMRMDLAKQNLSVAGMIQETINQKRDDERAQEQLGWARLQDAATTYGASAPQALIDALSSQLPNVDVKAILSQPTLAQAKKATGSSGGVSSFAYSQLDSMGQAPSFEDFLKQKEDEQGMTLSPASRTQLRKEWEASKTVHESLNPSTILKFAEDKAIAMGPTQYKNAMKVVNDRIAAGDLQGAQDFADGLGGAPSQTERNNFTQALVVKQGVQQLGQLIQELGMQGPVIGRFREMNPYDDRVVRFKQLTTEVVPGLARGIFREVGVLTDTDVRTYTSVMANPELTKDQAMQATSDLLHKIDLSMNAQIDVWNASKMNVREFRNLTNSSASAPQPTTDVSSFLSSHGL